jgi:hypothetical protein
VQCSATAAVYRLIVIGVSRASWTSNWRERTMTRRVDSADVATARPPSFRAMEGTTNPRDGREASAAVTAARGAHQAAAGSGGATSPRSQGVSSGSPPSPRGGIMSRVWEKLSGSPPKGADSLPSSPPSPGARDGCPSLPPPAPRTPVEPLLASSLRRSRCSRSDAPLALLAQ